MNPAVKPCLEMAADIRPFSLSGVSGQPTQFQAFGMFSIMIVMVLFAVIKSLRHDFGPAIGSPP
jgi:hypothetical protein